MTHDPATAKGKPGATTSLRDGDSVILITIQAGANERTTTRYLYVCGASGAEPLSPDHAQLLQAAGIPIVAAYATGARTFILNSDTANKSAVAFLKERGAIK
jgi:hypothetical protein